jgi:hypothetical protein
VFVYELDSPEATARERNRLPATRCGQRIVHHGVLAVDAGLNLRLALRSASRDGAMPDGALDFWSNVSDRLRDACAERILELAEKDYCVAAHCYFWGRISIEHLIQRFGVQRLFQVCFNRMYRIRTVTVTTHLLWPALLGPSYCKPSSRYDKYLLDLRFMGKHLLSVPPPWVTDRIDGEYVLRRYPFVEDAAKVVDLPRLEAEVLFGAFVVMAIHVEHLEKVRKRTNVNESLSSIVKSGLPRLDRIRWLLLARVQPARYERPERELGHLGFSPEQSALAQAWFKREVDFVKHSSASSEEISRSATASQEDQVL